MPWLQFKCKEQQVSTCLQGRSTVFSLCMVLLVHNLNVIGWGLNRINVHVSIVWSVSVWVYLSYDLLVKLFDLGFVSSFQSSFPYSSWGWECLCWAPQSWLMCLLLMKYQNIVLFFSLMFWYFINHMKVKIRGDLTSLYLIILYLKIWIYVSTGLINETQTTTTICITFVAYVTIMQITITIFG